MASERGDRGRLDADAWRRIGAVLDRVSGVDLRGRPDALEEACRAEGIRVEDVRPYLEADDSSGRFPGQLDPAILKDVLHALAAGARSAPLEPGASPWSIRDPLAHRRWRHGRGLQGARHTAESHRRPQTPDGSCRGQSRRPQAIRARGPCNLDAESSPHLHAARRRRARRHRNSWSWSSPRAKPSPRASSVVRCR